MRYRRLLTRTAPLAAAAVLSLGAAPANAATSARAAAVTACPAAVVDPSAANVAQVERTVLCLVNRERTSRGLRSLRSSSKLARAAAGHSHDMVRRGYFDHVSPGGSTMQERIQATGWLSGARSFAFGENLAWGNGELASPLSIVQSWMSSAGHKRNILTAKFSELGVGIALGTPRGAGGATYTTNFGAKG
jgi:uncharacterized protein YkwD